MAISTVPQLGCRLAMVTAMWRHCVIRSLDAWLRVGSEDPVALPVMGAFIGSRPSNESPHLECFFNQFGQLPADQFRKAGVNETGAYRKPFVRDAVGFDGKGGIADGNRQGVLLMRTRSSTSVELNDEKPGIDGLPDGDKEHVVLGGTHH